VNADDTGQLSADGHVERRFALFGQCLCVAGCLIKGNPFIILNKVAAADNHPLPVDSGDNTVGHDVFHF